MKSKTRNVRANGLLLTVKTLEQTENLQGGYRWSSTFLETVGERWRDREGIIAGGDENGGIGGDRNALLKTFKHTFHTTNLGKSNGFLVGRELDRHGIEIGGLY